MTQEEKAKAYDEAIEKARKLATDLPNGRNDRIYHIWDLESIFPELRESEDEKIRKELIEHVKDQQSSFISAPDCRDKYEEEENNKYNSWIAWLEKQGEQKPIIEMITPEESLGIDSETYNDIVNTCIFGENKPKFKVGDWIVNRLGNIWHIDSFNANNYQVTTTKGEHNYFPINIQDRMHIWTIADAKDGDILCTPNGNTFIFKTIDGDKILDYCGLYFNKFFSASGSPNGSSTHYDKCNYHPATKEQRDLLFQKMKEFGYEWDGEKKELKKIEQKPTQETEPFEAEHGKYYYCIKDYFCGGRKQASKGDVIQALRGLPIMGLKDASEYFLPVSFIKCNSAWSEDDDLIKTKIMKVLLGSETFLTTEETNECVDWLKSIKQRIKKEAV